MKKILYLLPILALIPLSAFAIPSSVDRITDHIEPLIKTDFIRGDHFIATTTTSSVFPNASTTNTTVSNVLYLTGLSNGCLQVASGVTTSTGANCLTSISTSSINYWRVVSGGLETATTTDFARAAYFVATSTGGVSSFAGSVGVGTTVPAVRVHVVGAGNQELLVESLCGATNYSGQSQKTDSGEWGMFVGCSGHPVVDGDWGLFDFDAALYRMVVKDNGNVGIGTTTPTEQLVVQSNAIIGNTLSIGNTGVIGAPVLVHAFQVAQPSTVAFPDETAASDVFCVEVGGNCNVIVAGTTDVIGCSDNYVIYTKDGTVHCNVNFQWSEDEDALIIGTMIGINDSTPTYALTIGQGSIMLDPDYKIFFSGEDADGFDFIEKDENNDWGNGAGTMTYGSTISKHCFINGEDGFMLGCFSTGRLGIGTSTPQAALHITTNAIPGVTPLLISSSTGATMMTLTSASRLGLGTSTPSNQFQIYATPALTTPTSMFIGDSCGASFSVFTSNTAFFSQGAKYNGTDWIGCSTGASHFGGGGGETVFYGNVGLTPGNTYTPTPRWKLNTTGDVLMGSAIDGVTGAVTQPTYVNLGARYGSSAAGNSNNMKLMVYEDGTLANRYGIGLSGGLLEFGVGNTGQFAWYHHPGTDAGTQLMRLDASGNLGIGTQTTIGVPLELAKGGVTVTGTMAVNTGFYQDKSDFRGVNIGYDTSGQIGTIVGATGGAASQLAFWTFTGSAWGERMRINSVGNVGIGTTTPARQLTVSTSTGTSTIMLDSTSATQGSCIVMKDYDGAGYTYLTAANGILLASTNPCM